MGKVKYSNNAVGHSLNPILAGATQLDLDDASFFPGLGLEDWTYVSVGLEVVKVVDIDIVAGTLLLDPATPVQQGYPANQTVELRMTSQLLDALGDMGEY